MADLNSGPREEETLHYQLVHLPTELLRLVGHSVDCGFKRVVHLQVLLLLGHLAKGLA